MYAMNVIQKVLMRLSGYALKSIHAAPADSIMECMYGLCTGMFMSIVTGSTPLAEKAWGYSNLMTSQSLSRLGESGGPRCCKRNSYISIQTAVEYVEKITGVRMEKGTVVCRHTEVNAQCIGRRCPFHPSNE